MQEKYVSIAYYQGEGFYSGDYFYIDRTTLGLKIGDKVCVSTIIDPSAKAIVKRINISEEEVNEKSKHLYPGTWFSSITDKNLIKD